MPVMTITCRYCRESVTRKVRTRNDKGHYCSRPCSDAARSILKEERKAIRSIAKRQQKKIRRLQAENARLKRELERRDYVSSAKRCKCNTCGVEFKQDTHLGAPRKYCPPCNDKILREAKKRQRRISRSKRRARMRATKVEPIDPFDIFDRDNWQCYICGTPTPKDKRGTFSDNAPELDHIVPLAKGGTHTRDNVACACRQCNHKKSDEMPYKKTLKTA